MKKTLTLALALIMAFVFSATPIFAANPISNVKYVAIGSSTANGYGLAGYDSKSRGTKGNAQASYIRMMQNYLGVAESDFTNLCVEGQRTAEVRAILDTDYWNKWNGKDAFLTKHISHYLLSEACFDMTYEQLQEYYKKVIKEADVITFDGCENDFGTYLGDRVNGLLTGNYFCEETYGNYEQTIYDIDELPTKVRKAIKAAEDAAFEQLSKYDLPTTEVRGIIDAIAYSAVTCCVNFSADVDMIYELNPDVKLMVFGVSNILRNLWISVDGQKINLGNITDAFAKVINTYVRALSKNSDKYKYVDCMDYEIIYEEIDREYTAHDNNAEETINAVKGEFAEPKELNGIIAGLGIASKDNPLDLEKIMSDGIEQSDLGKLINSRIMYDYGLALHPSVKGHLDKYEALLKAYSSKWNARKTFFKEKRTDFLSKMSKYSKTLDMVKMLTEYIDSIDVHDMRYVPYEAATTKKDGHKAHWQCNDCGKIYLDKLGTKETSLEKVTIKAKNRTSSFLNKLFNMKGF